MYGCGYVYMCVGCVCGGVYMCVGGVCGGVCMCVSAVCVCLCVSKEGRELQREKVYSKDSDYFTIILDGELLSLTVSGDPE